MLRHASKIFTFLHFKPTTSLFRTYCTNKNTTGYTQHLTSQQQEALNAISNKKSVFITGSAGTGKTFLVSIAIDILKNDVYKPGEVFVTSSTGIAACALYGQTLHSFAGIGLGVGHKHGLLEMVVRNSDAFERWKSVRALVIDDISMISGDLFDKLDYIARTLKGRVHKPWGGIQLIVSGDFFQLPPIMDDQYPFDRHFAFDAKCWNATFYLELELTPIFRQSEQEFIDLLQGVRRGRLNEEHLRILQQYCCKEPVDSSVTVPYLYPLNRDVKIVNDARLRSLNGKILKYTARDTGKKAKNLWKWEHNRGIAPKKLELGIGARVMLIKNMDVGVGLMKGATGTIVDFVEQTGKKSRGVFAKCLLPKVRFDSGLVHMIGPEEWHVMEGEKVLATRKQIPLILAWAISVHKCQGMTLDCLHTDLSKAFGDGMVYVALSRVRTLRGLYLSGFDSSKIKAHPKVLAFYNNHFGSKQ
ncbi:hypothetical protein IFM89_018378 [Coptis chinensis]|uniref:ATP-dependent DNA helicase n=1 Tax=Coptis chinensis TaxID=261450 RepID=A0A835LMN5_9MAGN|nr:hypothetical protein IFM89_018378 [Coptis chinensis]